MLKIAIFTEGQGEYIFIRDLLLLMANPNDISFECFELHGDSKLPVNYKFVPPTAKIYYQIINVNNDERVLSAIFDRSDRLVDQGFEIIGLRDMFSEAYKKRSHRIDPATSFFMETIVRETIKQNKNSEKIKMFFSIMELEAWILSMYSLFEKISSNLTVTKINENLLISLDSIDPESEFFHPLNVIINVFGIAGIKYEKSRDFMESIFGHMDLQDVLNGYEKGRCSSLRLFVSEIENHLSSLN